MTFTRGEKAENKSGFGRKQRPFLAKKPFSSGWQIPSLGNRTTTCAWRSF